MDSLYLEIPIVEVPMLNEAQSLFHMLENLKTWFLRAVS